MSRKTEKVLVCGGLPQSLVLFRGPLIREMRDGWMPSGPALPPDSVVRIASEIAGVGK